MQLLLVGLLGGVIGGVLIGTRHAVNRRTWSDWRSTVAMEKSLRKNRWRTLRKLVTVAGIVALIVFALIAGTTSAKDETPRPASTQGSR